MRNVGFSRTAMGAAELRIAHADRVLSDPAPIPVPGADADACIRREAAGRRKGLRLFVSARSRLAEDWTLGALQTETRRIVLLGYGLDTLAYRLGFAPGLRLFEVDHPATQVDKRGRLAAARIPATGRAIIEPPDLF